MQKNKLSPAHQTFLKQIQSFIPSRRIYLDQIRRLAWGIDAGFYRLVPQIVIRSENEIRKRNKRNIQNHIYSKQAIAEKR